MKSQHVMPINTSWPLALAWRGARTLTVAAHVSQIKE
jgi:hypothetical protein